MSEIIVPWCDLCDKPQFTVEQWPWPHQLCSCGEVSGDNMSCIPTPDLTALADEWEKEAASANQERENSDRQGDSIRSLHYGEIAYRLTSCADDLRKLLDSSTQGYESNKP